MTENQLPAPVGSQAGTKEKRESKHEDRIERLNAVFYIRWTSGPNYERAFLCVEDGDADMNSFAATSFGCANIFKAWMQALAALSHPAALSGGDSGAVACAHVPIHIEGKGYRCRDCGASLTLMGQGDSIEWATHPEPSGADAVPEALLDFEPKLSESSKERSIRWIVTWFYEHHTSDEKGAEIAERIKNYDRRSEILKNQLVQSVVRVGSPTVDLKSGDPVDGPIPTFRYDEGVK